MAGDSQAPVTYGSNGAPAQAVAAAWLLALLLVVLGGYLAGRYLGTRRDSSGRALLRVEVASAPAGASVYVDGELKGRTPVVLDSVRAGTRVFRLEKAGCQPLVRPRVIAEDGPVSFDLQPHQVGSISITTLTPKAEVLLDGEMAGFTPLTLHGVPSGNHQVTVRKANFDPATIPITVKAGETMEIAGVEMHDRILSMLEGLKRAEPQRIGHLIDLGHYYFINDRLDDSVDCFVRGLRLAEEPLTFDPKLELSEQDKALEMRMRGEDVQRLKSEINKHKSWPGRSTQRFREKLDIAMQLQANRNVANWLWVQQALQDHRNRRDYPKAEELLRDHLKANPGSDQGWIALVELSLERGDVPAASNAFEKTFDLLKANPIVLRQLGNSINRFNMRAPKDARGQVLGWAEKAFRQGLETAKDPNLRAQLLFELSNTQDAKGQIAEAVKTIEQALATTTTPEAAELWKLNLAEYLGRLGKTKEARAVLDELFRTARQESVRTTAQQRIQRIDELEKKEPKQ